jgi:HSP20 family protein
MERRVQNRPGQLARWDPIALFDELQEDMSRLWGKPGGMWPMMRSLRRLAQVPGSMMVAPRLDMFEREGNLIVKAELPGIKKEDVQVELEEGSLVIRGETSTENEVKEEQFYRMERTSGSFFRRVPLPFEAQPDEIQASMADGVLEVRIPRPPEQKSEPRRITVK